MTSLNLPELEAFIVAAKAATYVGSGATSLSYRPGSHDIQFRQGDYAYLDSYFGGQDFLGQEVVYFHHEPIWVMNYYGCILHPDKIDAATAGAVIKASLSALYREGRFLGAFQHQVEGWRYVDTNEGDVSRFNGKEWIEADRLRVYELVYHGGLVKP